MIKNAKGRFLVFLQNDEYPFLYKLNEVLKEK